MAAEKTHECIQAGKLTMIMWMMGLFMALVTISATASTMAVNRAGSLAEQTSLNTQALRRVDGSDMDIAVIKQKLEAINDKLNEINERMRKP
jgi:hypothetical protein